MKRVVHALAGALAMLTILSFLVATAVAEVFLSEAAVAAVKHAILDGLWVLIPALAITGGSGFALAGGRPGRLVAGKKRRMRVIAGNGLLILLPAAFFLAHKAAAGELDAAFYTVQAVEWLAGAAQLALLGLNARDGLRLRAQPGQLNGGWP